MNWATEVEPTPVGSVFEAINAAELAEKQIPEVALEQLSAAKEGAAATLRALTIPDGMLVGVEFAGSTTEGAVTVRVRQVMPAPAEAEPAEQEQATTA